MVDNDRTGHEAWRRSWIELLAYVDSLGDEAAIRSGRQMDLIQELRRRVEREEGGSVANE